MKKRKLLLTLTCAVLLGSLVWAFAAADKGDPLASLSYLTGDFADMVEDEVEDRLDESDQKLLDQIDDTGSVAVSIASVWTERCMKQEDVLLGVTGTGVLALAGSVAVYYDSGAVVDVTTGTVIESGGSLSLRHRYLVAEDTSAAFMAVSPTAVIDYQGTYQFEDSDLPDYNAMACALQALHMFRGTETGFGQGFDLENSTTRIQSLIMFIRVLGEEEQALAWTGSMPFKDVPDWAKPYVGFAYEKGYTNGISTTEFAPDMAANANQYTEFILRAMDYSSTANTDLSDTLQRSYKAGVLTAGETEAFAGIDTFLRAHLAYISYYALHAQLPDGVTLAETLRDKGVFTDREWKSAGKLVTTERF